MPQFPPAGAEGIGHREGTAERAAEVFPARFVVIEDGVELLIRQFQAPFAQVFDGAPWVPAAVIDLSHVVEKGHDGDAVGRLEPGDAFHEPVRFQGVLHQSARFRVVAAGAPREEIRRVQLSDDVLHSGTAGGAQDLDEFLFVGHYFRFDPAFPGPTTDDGEGEDEAEQDINQFLHYSRLKISTQLIAATIPMICGTVGTAAYRIREITHMITGAQASASGAMTIALP